MKRTCEIPECKKPEKSRGMCAGHVRRYERGLRGAALLAPIGNRGAPRKGLPRAVANAIEAAK